MKNNESFTQKELTIIYHCLNDTMSAISKMDEITEEDKRILRNNIRDVAYKVATKLEAIEDGNSC